MQLLQIHLAMAIGGKGYVTMTGEVAAGTASVEAGADSLWGKGLVGQQSGDSPTAAGGFGG